MIRIIVMLATMLLAPAIAGHAEPVEEELCELPVAPFMDPDYGPAGEYMEDVLVLGHGFRPGMTAILKDARGRIFESKYNIRKVKLPDGTDGFHVSFQLPSDEPPKELNLEITLPGCEPELFKGVFVVEGPKEPLKFQQQRRPRDSGNPKEGVTIFRW